MKKSVYIFITFIICILSFSYFVLNTKDKKVVYIYKDDGVSEESLSHTLSTFKNILDSNYPIKLLNAAEVINGQWVQDAALFVMPGGADLPYAEKLNGLGNKTIKDYVKNGGSYLGICAGAYYGSSYVEFDKDGKLEVLGSRELEFFGGKARSNFSYI